MAIKAGWFHDILPQFCMEHAVDNIEIHVGLYFAGYRRCLSCFFLKGKRIKDSVECNILLQPIPAVHNTVVKRFGYWAGNKRHRMAIF